MEFGRVLAAGETLYRDIRVEGPFLHPYPALYPLVLSVSIRAIPGPWLPGRLPAFAAYLGCVFLVLVWGWKRWGPALALALAGILLLSPTWSVWGTMARMDSLLVLLNFGAFMLFYSTEKDRDTGKGQEEWGTWAAVGMLNSLALMMKSSACTLTITVLVYFFAKKRWKEAIFF